MSSLQTGSAGEKYAVAYLQKQGYQILATNWRSGRNEIDIIAQLDKLIVFIEVKTRSGTAFGWPEEALSASQRARIARAAEDWLLNNKIEGNIRFDVISILKKDGKPDLHHIRDAFAP